MTASQICTAAFHRRASRVLTLLVLVPLIVGNLHAAEQEGQLFHPSDDVLAEVETARAAAAEEGKLLLVILGGNWCHDSRALAARVNQAPLSDLIEQNYETVFVDVGFLEIDSETVGSLGIPVYYATPTVLIIDPVGGRLINAGNRHQWGNAYTISMDESVEYFRSMAETDPADLQEPENVPPELEESFAQIDAFERAQAGRLYDAYSVIGPMLRAYKEGHAPDGFEGYWEEVREFRMRVPDDVASLREEAAERTASGAQEGALNYPTYSPFSWEEDASR